MNNNIREFESDPEYKQEGEGRNFHFTDELQWKGKVSVHKKWVSSAQPMYGADIDSPVEIRLAGGTTMFSLNIPYKDFLEWWMHEDEDWKSRNVHWFGAGGE